MSNREDAVVLGRLLGTFDGWDQIDGSKVMFYLFRPAAGVDLPTGDLVFDWQEGNLMYCNDNGTIIFAVDAATFCSNLPQVTHDETDQSS